MCRTPYVIMPVDVLQSNSMAPPKIKLTPKTPSLGILNASEVQHRQEEEAEDLNFSNVEGDPGVIKLKQLASLEGFGIKNPTDFPSMQDKMDLKRVINASPVDPSKYLPRANAVKSRHKIY